MINRILYFFTSLLLAVSLSTLVVKPVAAANSTFTVTVGNSPPSFSSAPAESPVSSSTTPTNVGTSLSFSATGSDPNGGSYFLIVCKTNQVQANDGAPPTCPGGSWCRSVAATSDTASICSYTAGVGDSESNDWYGFVCDGVSPNAGCSSVSQGSGNSGSPFAVNHSPTFNAITNDGSSIQIGSTVTWTTNASTLDSDLSGTPDTVKLVVCKTMGLANGDCDGGVSDRFCQSSLVASSPSCSYGIPVSTSDGINHAYVYLVDSHDLASTDALNGSDSSFNVINSAPIVSNVLINASANITLTEGTTTPVIISATVSDPNGCGDIATVTGHLYRSGADKSGCIAGANNDNYCYSNITCTPVVSGNTCSGTADTSTDYVCTARLSYVADPTDALTQYPIENWLSTVTAVDTSASSSSQESAGGVEVNSLAALTVNNSIDYGILTVGQKNDPIDRQVTVTATGNVGINIDLTGTNLTSGSNIIPVGQQKYALTSMAYDSATVLTTTPQTLALACRKSTITASPSTQNFFWGISIPTGIQVGNYAGINTITAVKSQSNLW